MCTYIWSVSIFGNDCKSTTQQNYYIIIFIHINAEMLFNWHRNCNTAHCLSYIWGSVSPQCCSREIVVGEVSWRLYHIRKASLLELSCCRHRYPGVAVLATSNGLTHRKVSGPWLLNHNVTMVDSSVFDDRQPSSVGPSWVQIFRTPAHSGRKQHMRAVKGNPVFFFKFWNQVFNDFKSCPEKFILDPPQQPNCII